LARAVYGKPSLLVLDEPNANLDEAGELALSKAVQEFKALGKTVVLISHRPGVLALADRVLVLRDGAVSHEGAMDDEMRRKRSYL
jgi:ATP-binding cassette subfamily C exporter for protease/lipase